MRLDVRDRALERLHLAHRAAGDLPLALDYYQKARQIRQEIGDRRGEATDLHNIGLILAAMGNRAEARQSLTQATHLFEEIKSPFAEKSRLALTTLAEG